MSEERRRDRIQILDFLKHVKANKMYRQFRNLWLHKFPGNRTEMNYALHEVYSPELGMDFGIEDVLARHKPLSVVQKLINYFEEEGEEVEDDGETIILPGAGPSRALAELRKGSGKVCKKCGLHK
jgi:hypothetical protein